MSNIFFLFNMGVAVNHCYSRNAVFLKYSLERYYIYEYENTFLVIIKQCITSDVWN
nr:MAG TPA: hypothetical protein [Caudoviricetes sp.]